MTAPTYIVHSITGQLVRIGSHGYVFVTRKEYERAKAPPYPCPDAPNIMLNSGPIMRAVNRDIQFRWLQQQLDGEEE